MTIFEAVKNMNEEQFSSFCFWLYNKGWNDGARGVCDEGWILSRLSNFEYDKIGEIE